MKIAPKKELAKKRVNIDKHIKQPIIKVTVTKEDLGYSAKAIVKKNFIATEGDNFSELQDNILEAINFTFEDEGIVYNSTNIKFEFDIESFFHFYRIINAKVLSERIGMNQSLLAQYIKGKKNPSPKQVNRILIAIQEIGKELSEVKFLQ